jgi:hypothetical protein
MEGLSTTAFHRSIWGQCRVAKVDLAVLLVIGVA